MSKKANGVNWSKQIKVRHRRSNVIDRLNYQLKEGTKNTKEGTVPLTEKDVKRINKELETLKSRI